MMKRKLLSQNSNKETDPDGIALRLIKMAGCTIAASLAALSPYALGQVLFPRSGKQPN